MLYKDNKARLTRTLRDFRKALPNLLRSEAIPFKEKITILIFAASPTIYRKMFRDKRYRRNSND